MKDASDIGLNRTGIGTAPIEGPKTIQGAEEGAGPASDGAAAALTRATYAREAERIGGVPPPATLKGAAKTVLKALQGEKASVFIDKLGERCAFERTGARLYELVLVKAEAYPSWPGGPSREDLLEIHRDELSHFGLLQTCLEKLGADPTAMTPSADIASNLSKGIPQVLADPRTDLRQCLEGLLVAELADNACWESLVELAQEAGQDEMAALFEAARQREQLHLSRVKEWVRQGVSAALSGKLPAQAERGIVSRQ
jgi:rubrerythrin